MRVTSQTVLKASRIGPSATEQSEVNKLVEHLFRHQAGQIVATLTRYFGLDNLDTVEDVVQETLLKALQQWIFRGVPQNPGAWILQTAKNHALDILRRQANFRTKEREVIRKLERDLSPSQDAPNVVLESELKDDQLRMIFACCHPVLSRETRIALTLKVLCGFNVPEIARAFLAQEPTIAQRIVRAKRRLRDEAVAFEMPETNEIYDRLDTVLDVLYLLFNEGYSAYAGENLVRYDLCVEAIRLTALLAEFADGRFPKVHALLALMFLQGSRLPARVGPDGKLLVLKEQNRSLWDKGMIQRGLHQLQLCAAGDEVSEYHLQAGIAACHALATDHQSTRWDRILSQYDQLASISGSPVVALNRAVALSMVEGPLAGLRELDRIKTLAHLKNYFLLPATYADFYLQIGDHEKALIKYRAALELVGTEPERRFLIGKVQECERASNGKPGV